MNTITHGEMARLRRSNPELFSTPLITRVRTWALWLGFVGTLAYGMW